MLQTRGPAETPASASCFQILVDSEPRMRKAHLREVSDPAHLLLPPLALPALLAGLTYGPLPPRVIRVIHHVLPPPGAPPGTGLAHISLKAKTPLQGPGTICFSHSWGPKEWSQHVRTACVEGGEATLSCPGGSSRRWLGGKQTQREAVSLRVPLSP